MLGINNKKIHSNSVGNKTDYEMFSMDFEEFLWAKGYNDENIKEILKHMVELKPFSDTELAVYKSLFLDYCVLGGMPDVIRGYIETGNFSGSMQTQEQIRLDYEEDVRKYAEGLDQTKIISVYRSIPAQLEKENKKFQFNKISKNANERKYKLYYSDTGLLVSALDEEAQEDFFVRTKNELIPVEVKSNNNKSKSLDALIKNDNYSDIKHGIKLGDFNIGYANNIYTFPYFCAFLIKEYLKIYCQTIF